MLKQIFAHLRRKPARVERYFIVVLLAGVIVAMAISLAIGLNQSVWFDEAYSITLARQTTDQLLYLTSVDTHPPLYYLLLKAWAGLFGFSEVALRSLSIVAMGGVMVLGGLLVRRLFGVRVALFTLPFIVFAPMLLRFGFEIRMYALAGLIGIAATYILVAARQAKQRNQWVLYSIYAVLVAAGMLTLYYTALLWMAHVVWLVWMARQEKRPIVRSPWFAALVVGALLFLPWLPVFMGQLGGGALAPIVQALTVENLAGIVSFMFVYQPVWQLSALVSLLVLFAMIAVGILTTKAFKILKHDQRKYLVLLMLYVLVPVAVLALVSLVRPMYIERYLAHVLLGAYLFVGVVAGIVVTKRPSKKALLTVSGLLAVLFVGVLQLAMVGNYNFQRLQAPEIKQAAAAISSCSPDQTILAADPYVAIELSYYLPACEVRFYSETADLSGGYAPLSKSPLHVSDPASELAGSREIIYVYYDQPKLIMPDGLMASSRQEYGNLNVAIFRAEL